MPTSPRRRTGSLDAFVREVLAAVVARATGASRRGPVIVTGGIGAGKTEAGLRLASHVRDAGLTLGGILAPRLFGHGETVGYNVLDLLTGEDAPFARSEPPGDPVGRFFVRPAGLAFAERALRHAAERAEVAFVDEVGRWELGGGGHVAGLREILRSRAVPVLFVRSELVDAVIETFGLRGAHVARLAEATRRDAAEGRRAFWEIVDSVPYPLLITLAEDGFPQSRPMTLIAHDEHTLWFPTSLGSRKVAQVQAHDQVTVLFVDNDRFNYASFHGVAAVDRDRNRARDLWRSEWRDDWPGGADDPDYGLLRIDGVRGFFLHGATGEAGEIDLRAGLSSVASGP